MAKELTPGGPVKKVTELACAVMLMGVMLSPITVLDMDTLSLSLSEYRRTEAILTEDLEAVEKQLLRTYIEQQCAAYILDEAKDMQIEGVGVSVQAKWRDETWVPYEVYISGALTAAEKQRLSDRMEAELGIGAERQHWNG